MIDYYQIPLTGTLTEQMKDYLHVFQQEETIQHQLEVACEGNIWPPDLVVTQTKPILLDYSMISVWSSQ